MWREYTRETPPRRGWAVATSAIALLGTTALAWIVTDRVNASLEFRLANWPIAFNSPDGFKLTSVDNMSPIGEYSDGQLGTATFRRETDKGWSSQLYVEYKLLEAATSIEDACAEMGIEIPKESEFLNFDGFRGVIAEQIGADTKGHLNLIGIGVHPCGIAVLLKLAAPLDDLSGIARFDRVFSSIRLVDWSIPRPPWASLPSGQSTS